MSKPRRLYIVEQWNEYKRRVVPADACAEQVKQTRMAFYAGATALMFVLMQSMSAGDDTQPEDVSVMEDIEAELRQFAQDAKNRKV